MKQPKEIVFATNNEHKLSELRQILGEDYRVVSLAEIGCHEELPEDKDTLEGNALQKARYVSDKYHVDCLADDTGLEVEALGGAPGVHTARYASAEGHDNKSNRELLLHNLQGVENRQARFVTVMALIEGGCATVFEGICPGRIATEESGDAGFGYDPLFIPDESDGRTFAMMSATEKNAISHRGRAAAALAQYLKD